MHGENTPSNEMNVLNFYTKDQAVTSEMDPVSPSGSISDRVTNLEHQLYNMKGVVEKLRAIIQA
jgi:hypothetical protein